MKKHVNKGDELSDDEFGNQVCGNQNVKKVCEDKGSDLPDEVCGNQRCGYRIVEEVCDNFGDEIPADVSGNQNVKEVGGNKSIELTTKWLAIKMWKNGLLTKVWN